MEPESTAPGDVVALDLSSGSTSSYGVNVLSQPMACRADGSVALVDAGPGESGDLVVVCPGGVRTVLGHGYLAVFPG